jgi:hypothetical protein
MKRKSTRQTNGNAPHWLEVCHRWVLRRPLSPIGRIYSARMSLRDPTLMLSWERRGAERQVFQDAVETVFIPALEKR